MPDSLVTTDSSALECLPPEQLDGANANAYTRIVSKMLRQHRLLSVHWELTYRCNETCTHCYLDVLKPNAKVAGELSTAQVTDGLDQLAAMGALNITFSGGEAIGFDHDGRAFLGDESLGLGGVGEAAVGGGGDFVAGEEIFHEGLGAFKTRGLQAPARPRCPYANEDAAHARERLSA